MAKEKKLTPLQEEALDNLKMWLRNPQGINLGAALGYSEFDIKNLINLAYSLLEQGKLPESRALYEGIHAMVPVNVQAMLGLGSIYAQQKHYPQAIELFTRVLEDEDETENLYALRMRGECYISSGNMEEAIADFKKVTELDPEVKSGDTQKVLGIIASAQQVAEKGGTLTDEYKGILKFS